MGKIGQGKTKIRKALVSTLSLLTDRTYAIVPWYSITMCLRGICTSVSHINDKVRKHIPLMVMIETVYIGMSISNCVEEFKGKWVILSNPLAS